VRDFIVIALLVVVCVLLWQGNQHEPEALQPITYGATTQPRTVSCHVDLTCRPGQKETAAP
jgi:hypothetical protein